MADLVRKSFYIHQELSRMIVQHIWENYLRTGRRLTESEVVREAIALFFQKKLNEDDPS